MLPWLLVVIILGSGSDVGFTREFASADFCNAAREQIEMDLGGAEQAEGHRASIRCVMREIPVSPLEAEQRRLDANRLAMLTQTPAEAIQAARTDAAIARNKARHR